MQPCNKTCNTPCRSFTVHFKQTALSMYEYYQTAKGGSSATLEGEQSAEVAFEGLFAFAVFGATAVIALGDKWMQGLVIDRAIFAVRRPYQVIVDFQL